MSLNPAIESRTASNPWGPSFQAPVELITRFSFAAALAAVSGIVFL
jgi:hypothetical protein